MNKFPQRKVVIFVFEKNVFVESISKYSIRKNLSEFRIETERWAQVEIFKWFYNY